MSGHCPRKIAGTLTPLLLLGGSVSAQTGSIRDWDLICFCNSRTSTPHPVVRMDNNGAILFAAKDGVSLAGLKSLGIPITESQVRLLEDWSLVAERDGVLRTAFPVLGAERIVALRGELRQLARKTVSSLRPLVDSIVRNVSGRGYPEASYAVVFSYVLDGLVWDRLWPDSTLVSDRITVERPFWNGAFWAVDPKRSNAPGTNSARGDDSTLVLLTWTDATLPLLRTVQQRDNLNGLIQALRTGSAQPIPAALEPYGFIRPDGKPGVLVIRERDGDLLSRLSLALADNVAREMTQWLATAGIAERLGTSNPGLGVLIAYHEFMWELLDELVDSGMVRKPPVLELAAPAPADVRPLITLVVK